jgi:acetoin utilization protein AcuB
LDSIQHAREVMAAHRVNQLPVIVEGRMVGIVTDRDLRDAFPSVFDVARSTARHNQGPINPSAITVESVMTPQVITISSKESIVEAARLMRRERIGAIPVIDSTRLVGILTRSDILDAFVVLAEAGLGEEEALQPKA